MRHQLSTIFLTGFILTFPLTSTAVQKLKYESSQLRINLTSRTPQQMAAFYEARGFNRVMLDKIRQYCFVTVYIHNKTRKTLWHRLDNWQFTANGTSLKRVNRSQLKNTWQHMRIPLAHQSTFRWTLLPEQLDFHPNEREGGNIVLPWTDSPVNIRAPFRLGKANAGQDIIVQLKGLTCNK